MCQNIDVVGITEIAQRAGTSPGTVRAWRYRHADTFPKPIQLAMGPVWLWPDVQAWLAIPRPMGRPPGSPNTRCQRRRRRRVPRR